MAKNDTGTVIPLGIFYYPIDIMGVNLSAVVTKVQAAVANNWGLNFPNSGIGIIDFNYALPRGWDNLTLTVYIYWAPSDTQAGNVKFNVEYRRIASGVTLIGGTSGGSSVTGAAPGITDRITKINCPFSLSATAEGEAMAFRIYRNPGDAADTYNGDARIYAVILSVVG